MEYRRYGETYYIRLDRGDEVISSLLEICQTEHVKSATFSGIGGCSEAQIQTFIPETGTFETRTLSGMLELVSLAGNIISAAKASSATTLTQLSPTRTETNTTSQQDT